MIEVHIKHRYTGAVLYTAQIPADTPSGLAMRVALEAAIGDEANLRFANLSSADLSSVDLRSVDLSSADLSSANLSSADLSSADLRSANLSFANLSSANLRSANLRSADLDGRKLIGDRPILQIGPIGSRSDYLVAYLTDAGVLVRAGCFFNTLDLFRAAVDETHGSNEHGREYAAAVALIEAHAALWVPAAEAQSEAEAA